MKILMSSYVFAPSVGGIETVSELLAPEFVRAGHEVVLVTRTGEDDDRERPYEVVRGPGPGRLIELVRWCDVYFQNNISLTYAWPLLFVQRPWIIAHHTWLGESSTKRNLRARLKRALLRFGTNATISEPVAADIDVPSTIVGNPFANMIFRDRPEINRRFEIAYLGRLVPDKGVDLLIDSLADLRAHGQHPCLTIIGSGSEEKMLRELTRQRGLSSQVQFVGAKTQTQCALLLNAHQILVAPSRWPEPFGLVALEGIASGCVMVASRVGGLPQAVGPCGLLINPENRAELTDALLLLLTQPEKRASLMRDAQQHLNKFEPITVAARYLEIFERSTHVGEAVLCR